jgi:phosphoserine phosphatase
VKEAILARHGESTASVRAAVSGDPAAACPLTEEGERQARRLGELLAGTAIDLCVVTEFERTQRTAALALAGRDVSRLVLPALNDPRAGRFEGRPLEEYRAWARENGPLAVPPGGGESRAAVARRLASGFAAVLARPERTILVVGHSLPLAYVLAAADGRDPTPRVDLLAYAEPYRISPGALARAVERLERWAERPVFA